MKPFEEHFDFHSIVDQLAIQRAKLSFFIHKNSYLDPFCKKGTGFQIKDKLKQEELVFLRTVLPPRNQWSRPNSFKKRSQFKSTIELNQEAIKNRVYEVHRRFCTGIDPFLTLPKWYQELRKFIFDLRININNTNFSIKKPVIFPAKKDPSDPLNMERRPLAKFFLVDRIVLSLTNKYLTKIFDKLFLDCSFAFRSANSFKPGPTYHDAVEMLKDFRLKHISTPLYVSECDIKKFFDCVEHDIIWKQYDDFKKSLLIKGYTIDDRAEGILRAYTHCYSFNGDVYPKNKNEDYWGNLNDQGGNFGWVAEFDKKYKTINAEEKKVGIPQGGALSGLIVNILLHNVDTALVKTNGWNRDYLYLRYCDDMVIVHQSSEACSSLFTNYQDQLRELNLIPHICAELKSTYCKQFWNDVKSRDVYLWSQKGVNLRPHSPWISFVGYMVHESGTVKIRKKSIVKQFEKHQRELKKVIKRLNDHTNDDLVNREFAIVRSFETKLYLMSVGKINISTYRTTPVDMCWGAGFRMIDDNKFTRQQLKRLDKSSKETVLLLKQYFSKRKIPHIKDEENLKKAKIIRARYPHSFYSILHRPRLIPFKTIS